MAYDKNKLELKLNKIYKILPTKYITVNNKCFLDGDNDLFVGLNLKQIQFLIMCIGLADNQLTRIRENIKDNKYTPNLIQIEFTHDVIDIYLKNNAKRNIDILGEVFSTSEVLSRGLFYCNYNKEERKFILLINTDIFCNKGCKDFTKVYIGDIMATKSLSGVYVKLKTSKFANISQAMDDLETIDKEEDISIILSKEKFKLWSNCGKEISKYLLNGLKSINSENNKKIFFKYEENKNDSRIILYVNRLSYFEHVKESGLIVFEACNSIKQKENKIKIIEVKM